MKRIKFIVLLLIIFSFFNVNANTLKVCEYSDEFKKWLDLSESERKGTIMPPVCKNYQSEERLSFARIPTLKGINTIPESYSLVDENLVTSVKNQMNTGSCWAFAANDNCESYMLRRFGETYDLSERHMEYATSKTFLNNVINPIGFNREVNDGGNYLASSAYFISHTGPILESEMPFENNGDKIALNNIQNKNVILDVNEVMYLQGTSCSDISETMKNHLMTKGSLEVSVYMTLTSQYYNSTKGALYYNGTNSSNHAVSIVGWDDNYSKTNFGTTQPSSNGAWLIKNSYGSTFGNNGYFYVSYEDALVCDAVSGIRDIDKTLPDNYYMHDQYGVVNNVGNGTNTAVAANIFTKENKDELLTEVTVGSINPADLEIYVVPDGNTQITVSNATHVASATMNYGGYITVKLDNPVLLSDTKFAILVKYTEKNGTGYPVGVSMYYEDTMWENVTATAGESYISLDGGTNFFDAATAITGRPLIASIKAGTEDYDYTLSSNTNLSNLKINYIEGGNFNLLVNTTNISNNEELTVKIYNSSKVDVTNKFTISGNVINNNQANILINVKANTLNIDTYTIEVIYDYKSFTKTFSISDYKLLSVESIIKPDVLYDIANESFTINLLADNYIDGSIITCEVSDNNNNNQTSMFDIVISEVKNNKSLATITLKNSIKAGIYTFKFTCLNISVTQQITIVDYIDVLSISLNSNNEVVKVGNNISLTATINPTNATNKNIIWTSSNEEVASVDSTGFVQVIGKGITTIRAASKSNSSIYSECIVKTISTSIELDSIKLVGHLDEYKDNLYEGYGGIITGNINLNDTSNVEIKIYNSLNDDVTSNFGIDLNKVNDTKYIYEINVSSNIVTDNYKVLVVANYLVGTKVIDSKSDTFNMNVYSLSSIMEINCNNVSMMIGDTYQLEPKINISNYDVKYTYSVSDSSIATINENGLITAKKVGNTKIIIKIENADVIKDINLVVTEKKLNSLDIFKNTKYVINDNIISRIDANTLYDDFLNSLMKIEGITVTIEKYNLTKSSSYISTGDKLHCTIGDEVVTYKISVLGDVTGDGLVKLDDIMTIAQYLYKDNTILKDEYLLAADYNMNDKYELSDIMTIANDIYK